MFTRHDPSRADLERDAQKEAVELNRILVETYDELRLWTIRTLEGAMGYFKDLTTVKKQTNSVMVELVKLREMVDPQLGTSWAWKK